MNVPVESPQQFTRYVDAEGRLTTEGVIMFQKLVEAIQDLQSRVEALEP